MVCSALRSCVVVGREGCCVWLYTKEVHVLMFVPWTGLQWKRVLVQASARVAGVGQLHEVHLHACIQPCAHLVQLGGA